MLCFPPEGINTPKIIKKSDQTAKALHVLLFRIVYDVIRVKWTSGLITITKSGRFPSIGEHFWEDSQIIQLFHAIDSDFPYKEGSMSGKMPVMCLKGQFPPKIKNTVIVYSASLFEACLLSLYYGTRFFVLFFWKIFNVIFTVWTLITHSLVVPNP